VVGATGYQRSVRQSVGPIVSRPVRRQLSSAPHPHPTLVHLNSPRLRPWARLATVLRPPGLASPPSSARLIRFAAIRCSSGIHLAASLCPPGLASPPFSVRPRLLRRHPPCVQDPPCHRPPRTRDMPRRRPPRTRDTPRLPTILLPLRLRLPAALSLRLLPLLDMRHAHRSRPPSAAAT